MQKQIQTFQEELEHSKIQFLDMQSAERIVRIDLEQIKRNVYYLVVNHTNKNI